MLPEAKETVPVDTDRLVDEHKDLVYHLIRRTVRDWQSHEEIFQQVFLNVLKALPSFEGRSKLSTWIASIAVHTCYQFMQQARKEQRVESFEAWLDRRPEPGVSSDVHAQCERSEVRMLLERHLGNLAPRYALPVTMFYLEGLSYKEISEILKTPLGTVKTHLFRGLAELKKRIAGGDDEHMQG